tara:strand:+ start:168 stop:524 length:357 start_codon:yes stop_codon:yes gene_type:complete
MAFKMKGMHFGNGTGSALKFFGLFGDGEEKEKPKPPPEITVVPKKNKEEKTSTKKSDTVETDIKTVSEIDPDISQKATREYSEQNQEYGYSNPNAQEAEDTIGESARSVIGRSERFNI